MASFFTWLGDKVKTQVSDIIDGRMNSWGQRVVARAVHNCPKRTGQLANSIGYVYRQSDKKVIIHADAPYAFFVEFGTRLMRASPYLRPALIQEGTPFGVSKGSAELQFAQISTPGTMPMPRANAAAIASNTARNKGLNKALGKTAPKVVFHGDTAASMRHYKPAIRSRYGVERRKPRK